MTNPKCCECGKELTDEEAADGNICDNCFSDYEEDDDEDED